MLKRTATALAKESAWRFNALRCRNDDLFRNSTVTTCAPRQHPITRSGKRNENQAGSISRIGWPRQTISPIA
ncbi:hypothetical protein AOE01nite_24120 [Acetobacter oeni]|uniref:Uncharacterized protein n=1 Tax=Acetobacter oeni TaxID=304077 RepID=A0A511XMM4_9PROT|nr:hypothetical protein AA21952_0064 [Acetobacter oeni LMG 21952]GEN64188.1 hypothetical protein AOE01nite_24120 [Acetobacter oeni]